jgi:hypothetical protein
MKCEATDDMEVLLKFKCIWCWEKKEVKLQRSQTNVLEINLDDYRVCTRCKLERKNDAVSGT